MSTNKVSDGKVISVTPSAAIHAGDLVHIGSGIIGVALKDIGASEAGMVAISDCWDVLKGTTALSIGGAIYVKPNSTTAHATLYATAGGTLVRNAYPTETVSTGSTLVNIRFM